jgi:hypothetical protein
VLVNCRLADQPVTFRESVHGHLTDFEWNELLMSGTDLPERQSLGPSGRYS